MWNGKKRELMRAGLGVDTALLLLEGQGAGGGQSEAHLEPRGPGATHRTHGGASPPPSTPPAPHFLATCFPFTLNSTVNPVSC